MVLGFKTNENVDIILENFLVKVILVRPDWVSKYVPIYVHYGVRLRGINVFYGPAGSKEVIIRYLDYGESKTEERTKNGFQKTKVWEMRVSSV